MLIRFWGQKVKGQITAGLGPKQVLQQEAYPAIWRPIDAKNSGIPGAIPPNRRKPVRDRAKFHADR